MSGGPHKAFRRRRARFWAGDWEARRHHLVATILIGFGAFNQSKGIVDHQVLGLHHVTNRFSGEWLFWDLGFLGWGRWSPSAYC
ncbi:DUF2243 domain-containing protein [Rhizobium sp. SIMBA_035]